MEGRVYIGTSGYTYKSWDAAFYPSALPKRLQLEYYATQFPTVEINATFYRLPTLNMVNGWARRVPKGFTYALKGSRFITHMKKLANLDGALDEYFDRIRPMKPRVGIILWQLPPFLQLDLARLDKFLARLRRYRYRHAVEFRHYSWYDEPKTFDVLRRHNVAHASLSTLNMPMNLTVTSDQVYVRFHGLQGGFAHDYTRSELEPWAQFCQKQAAAGRTVFAYFNNDVNVRAPENARLLMAIIGPAAVLPADAPGSRTAPRKTRRAASRPRKS